MTARDGSGRTYSDLAQKTFEQYEDIHRSYEPDGWICGRITMEPFAGSLRSEAEVARENTAAAPREDFIAPGTHESFAFAVDSRGRLAWTTNDIDGDHVVAILSERVSDEYLTLLRMRGVSYILAGSRAIDFPMALDKIGKAFGVGTLMLEGGGRINGSMLRAGMIDEVSLLLTPVADGKTGTPSLFDLDGDDVAPHRLSLISVEQRAGDMLWLRYRIQDSRET